MFSYFHRFKERFDSINVKHKLKLQLISYLISNHPACEAEDIANLVAETNDMGFQLGTSTGLYTNPIKLANAICYSGYHPYALKKQKHLE
ncbi:hypothetical protein [Hyunsoonleella jejuensis]|uniref:hypothetical protein n=1 Tax=Hyunsoonleella jejuensis TaxID=419940 RepID=UPI000B830049|nr:hypothetical protein [Hyunsoonleella jejuensis]